MERGFTQIARAHALRFSELLTLRTKEDFLYLSDIETYELLHISAARPEDIHPRYGDYHGRKCYEVLQGRSSPCPFCTNHLLRDDRYYIWRHHNDLIGRDFVLKDKLVEWEGRKVRMEVVMDVTSPERMCDVLIEAMQSRSLLLDCMGKLQSEREIQQTFNDTLASVCEYYAADRGLIQLFVPSLCAAWAGEGVEPIDTVRRPPPEDMIAEWTQIFRRASMILIPDIGSCKGLDRWFWQRLRDAGIDNLCILPLFQDDAMAGVVALVNARANLNELSVMNLIALSLERRVARERMQWRQSTDSLTGAYSFEGFRRRAEQILAARGEALYAISYVDIKRFKTINDLFGYDMGDRLLRFWAGCIGGGLREDEAFCRVSGDNLYLLDRYERREELFERFERVAGEVRQFPPLCSRGFEVEMTAGIYLVERDEDLLDLNSMLDRANIAQKSVKNRPGSRCALFTEAMREQLLREVALTQHLHDALQGGEFRVYYQPQYNFVTGQMSGCEALARWQHPELGWVSPAEFIPLLERAGLISEMDRYVWESACRQMRAWMDRDDLPAPPAISLNVSRMDIYDSSLCEILSETVARYALPPARVRIEITESAYVQNARQLISTVNRLRALGFAVEMDDFGSGYSSLNMLKDVPVDALKLDMRFLSGGSTTRGGSILSSVVRMAHWLNLPVVAEGVETREQADYLKSIGCELMQGFYFARPVPAEEFETILSGTDPMRWRNRVIETTDPLSLAEFLDTRGKTSFIFNHCIGGAALLEYSAQGVEALLVNDKFYEAIGVARERFEANRADMMRFVHEDDRDGVSLSLQRTVEKGRDVFEMRIRGAQKTRWARCTAQHLSANEQRHILFVLVEDATGHHVIETRLRETSAELETVVSLVPGGVFRCDGEGRFTYVSPGLIRMLGYAREDLKSRFDDRPTRIVCEADREEALATIRKMGDAGGTAFGQYRVCMADGTLKWVYGATRRVTDETGGNSYYTAIVDIDQQKQAETDGMFAAYGKGMALIYDEVYDMDFARDEVRLSYSSLPDASLGLRAGSARADLEDWLGRRGVEEADRAQIRRFVSAENAAGAFARGEPRSIEYRCGERWWRKTLLPLTRERCLFCEMDVTAVHRAEQLAALDAEYNAMTAFIRDLPVGAGVFEVASGRLRPVYISDAIYQIFNETPEAFRARVEQGNGGGLPAFFTDEAQLEAHLRSSSPLEQQIALPREGAGDIHIRALANFRRQKDGRVLLVAAFLSDTERVGYERRLRWQTAQYQLLSELPGAVIFDYDPETDAMKLCRNLPEKGVTEYTLSGYSRRAGKTGYIAPEFVEEYVRAFGRAVSQEGSGTMKYRAAYFGGSYRWVRAHYISLADGNGRIYRMVGRVDDIEDEVRREEELRTRAEQDQMTGLLNRTAMERAVDALLDQGVRGALFVADIDNFKQINDTLGHLRGDAFLQEAARRVRSLFREGDLLARVGGDEFAAFLRGDVERSVLKSKACGILRAFGEAPASEVGGVCLSVGVAETGGGGERFASLYERADQALYTAKEHGKACYAIFDTGEIGRLETVGVSEALSSPVAWAHTLAEDVFGILYHAEESERGINEALGHVGRWLDVSRVYIFENLPGDEAMRNTFEWVGDGVQPVIDQLQNVPYASQSGADYRDNFDMQGIFYCRDVSRLPAWQYELLRTQGVKALLQQAVRQDGRIVGFIGFDECRENRCWTRTQVETLVRVAEMIALFLWRMRSNEAKARDAGERS